MSETNQKILDMILKNASANEIVAATGLSNKQLFYRLNMLKIKGYNFSRKYYSDGEIVYKLNKGFEKDKEVSLLTSPNDTEFKAVFISDLHLSNKYDRVDLLNRVYEFCAKEGINIIINAGDILDGCLGFKNCKKIESIEKQIEYALKVYPYDKHILNFTCLGNHDYSILENSGQNLETILSSKRHDIISLGYGIGKLNIKNDQIIVSHPKTPKNNIIDITNSGLMLVGHTHKSQNTVSGNLVNIHLTSLSNLKSSSSQEDFTLPGFVKATFDFNNGIFKTGIFEQYIFMDNLYKVNESRYDLFKGKDTSLDSIKYEEERIPYVEETINIIEEKPMVKGLTNEDRGLSQIEKFNKRYNRQ